MVHTVNVTDRSPKNIVRQLLLTGRGPRDSNGMFSIMHEWVNSISAAGSFSEYCRGRSWTLAQVLAIFDWQCCYVLADGIDTAEFEAMWQVFQPIVRDQELLNAKDVTKMLTGPIPAPNANTRAAFVEV